MTQGDVQTNLKPVFDQHKITGVAIKIILPQGSGTTYILNSELQSVNLQPSRVTWAFDPNDQIGIAATAA